MRYVDRSYSERLAQYMYIVFFARKKPRNEAFFFLKNETNTRHTYFRFEDIQHYMPKHSYLLWYSKNLMVLYYMSEYRK